MGLGPQTAGWLVNDKRVERIWRREVLKVPAKQPKRGRIWDDDGSFTDEEIGLALLASGLGSLNSLGTSVWLRTGARWPRGAW